MSVDLYDMAERAETLVRKTNFQGMTQDEIVGLFYQEFCEPTVAEEERDIKIEWMLHNGFKKDYCGERKINILSYNDEYSWTYDEIMFEPLKNIKAYKEWYEGKITESELDKLLSLSK